VSIEPGANVEMVEKTFPHEDITDDPAYGEIVLAENVTFENFLKFFGNHHAEWLVGKVISVVTNNTQHNAILGFVHNLFSLFLGYKHCGRVLLAGVPMKITKKKPVREPDLLIVLNENAHRIKETYLQGPADIIVEIVSPESTNRDRGAKLAEYESAGVPEYWLLDPLRTESIVYALGEDGRYHPLPKDAEGRLMSKMLPGFVLHPDLLWHEEPPTGAELVALVQQMVEESPKQ
jgi:Uma2 family endonuclease